MSSPTGRSISTLCEYGGCMSQAEWTEGPRWCDEHHTPTSRLLYPHEGCMIPDCGGDRVFMYHGIWVCDTHRLVCRYFGDSTPRYIMYNDRDYMLLDKRVPHPVAAPDEPIIPYTVPPGAAIELIPHNPVIETRNIIRIRIAGIRITDTLTENPAVPQPPISQPIPEVHNDTHNNNVHNNDTPNNVHNNDTPNNVHNNDTHNDVHNDTHNNNVHNEVPNNDDTHNDVPDDGSGSDMDSFTAALPICEHCDRVAGYHREGTSLCYIHVNVHSDVPVTPTAMDHICLVEGCGTVARYGYPADGHTLLCCTHSRNVPGIQQLGLRCAYPGCFWSASTVTNGSRVRGRCFDHVTGRDPVKLRSAGRRSAASRRSRQRRGGATQPY
jgi:hypothetical protein